MLEYSFIVSQIISKKSHWIKIAKLCRWNYFRDFDSHHRFFFFSHLVIAMGIYYLETIF